MTNTHPDRQAAIGRAVTAAREQAPPVTVIRRMSQAILAEQMRDLGHKWTQATVSKTELGQRPLLLREAVDLARILGINVTDLLRDT